MDSVDPRFAASGRFIETRFSTDEFGLFVSHLVHDTRLRTTFETDCTTTSRTELERISLNAALNLLRNKLDIPSKMKASDVKAFL